MSEAVRPRRSVLYMPGANARALEKAKELPADALILDLEDAVAPDAKETARAQVVAAVKGGGYGRREIAIRVNGLDTRWGPEDVKAAAAAGPDAILFPKIDTADAVLRAVRAMEEAGAPEAARMWAMMETPLGVLNAKEVAGAHPRLDCLVMGTNDIAKDLHAAQTPDRLPFVTALGLSLLAARAYGRTILDGVYNDIRDAEGFRAVCAQGRDMGFDGKTLIHPSQIEPTNEIFSPSADQLAEYREIIDAFAEAEAEGKGVVTVRGRMIENLHVEHARRMIEMADAVAEMARTAV